MALLIDPRAHPKFAAGNNDLMKRNIGPNLPFDVQKRVIYFVLVVGPSYPATIAGDDCIIPQWDYLAGHIGRQANDRLHAGRITLVKTALNLARVSRSWKVDCFKN